MINLLPTPEKNEIRKEYHLRVVVVCMALLSSVLVAMVFSFLPTYLFILSRYGAFLAELQSDETQSRISQVKDMEMTVRETNKKIETLKRGATVLPVQDIFLTILKSKTPGVSITAITYDSGGAIVKRGKEVGAPLPATVTIQGRSSDRSTLLAFKDALVQKKDFVTVDLPISSLVKETDLSFGITITMAPIDAKKTP